MNLSFYRYFLGYIFKSRTRQKLLFLSVIGLVLSSFSLVVLQGVMGGLQNGLVGRSKNILGSGAIELNLMNQRSDEYKKLITTLNNANIEYIEELQLELMIKNDNLVSALIIHGVDMDKWLPPFFDDKDKSDLILGSDLGRNIRGFYGTKVTLITPSHTNFLLQEAPRQGTTYISDFILSELPEIDSAHGWVRLSFLQNLIRERSISKIRFFGESAFDEVQALYANGAIEIGELESWEKKNSTLVWALNLETKVMLFLFVGMSFLIGICITSGFLIFYNKIRVDLASFWILGLSKDQILKLVYRFGQSLSIVFCFLGLLLGVAFLALLDSNQFVIMPEYFVERKVPVNIDSFEILIAFLVPYLVASLFTHFTFSVFNRNNNSFISLIRKVR